MDIFKIIQKKEKNHRVVVRLSTSCWHDKKGMHIKKSLTYLKRKSIGFNSLEEDLINIGADGVEPTITNLYTSKDGIYELAIINERTDWETGEIEDYDYMLTPYKG